MNTQMNRKHIEIRLIRYIVGGAVAAALSTGVAIVETEFCYKDISRICPTTKTLATTCPRLGCGRTLTCVGTSIDTYRDIAQVNLGDTGKTEFSSVGYKEYCNVRCTVTCPMPHAIPYTTTLYGRAEANIAEFRVNPGSADCKRPGP